MPTTKCMNNITYRVLPASARLQREPWEQTVVQGIDCSPVPIYRRRTGEQFRWNKKVGELELSKDGKQIMSDEQQNTSACST